MKSRLAAGSSQQAALTLYEKMLKMLLRNLSPSKHSLELHYTGCEYDKARAQWPDQSLILQADGDLGQKLQHALKRAFSESAQALSFIGADCPELDAGVFDEVDEKLRSSDVVIGPASDGGYYLIAMKSNHQSLFKNIDWGTDKVLQETLLCAEENGLDVVLLEERNDMDHWEDIPHEWQQQVMELI
ncbi:MAG: glycosyltransferase [Lentisphaeraceae bacterium]|nr:glycosyltransferase [Lentisphaeraceae bacterium]